jgi:integrase
MRWSLVDLEERTARLRRQIVRQRGGAADPVTGRRKGKLVEKDLKTDASRATLMLPDALVEVLTAHRAQQRRDRMAARVWVDPDLVFATRVGTAYEPRNVNRMWEKVCTNAGVRPLKVHDLRHAAATLAFAEGASIKEIQAQLRHARSWTTANIYVDVFESVRRGTADRMDGVLRRLAGA